ncbi:SH3 domain-containing protein [Streptomyces sp. Je 1-79]|uniref:SH3 domain-containing protein n=1 Tax=Streptomyces sp. Je 1-79 TaxID=2943847 RepID=UPI0021A4ED52|nr:SH3 domain-containing protein [Streptomyces sp. Je 1-79]MCT4354486.1 SH3 domain-containing protein [Streptomyces sp. Je 1-79]
MGVEETKEAAAAAELDGVAAMSVTRYPVAPGVRVNVRSGPGTQFSVVRILPAGTWVAIRCQTPGQRVTGPYGTTNIWDNIASGEFISDAYVKTGSDGYVAPRCG